MSLITSTAWSPNKYAGRVKPVRHIVIHTMEAKELPDTAENVAKWFQDPKARASAHYCLDNNSIVQGVKLSDTAWACPGFNASGVQFEHAGFAAQNAGWDDKYSQDMLHRSAQLAADVADDLDIKVRRLTATQLRDGTISGFLGHGDATAAGIAGNTHTDPGPHFPWDDYLDLVTAFRSGVTPKPPKPAPTQADWVAGPKVVSAWQRYERSGFIDGRISRQPSGNRACMPADHWTTVDWVAPAYAGVGSNLIICAQRRLGVKADGFAGPKTWKAIQRWLDVTADGIAGNHTIEALAHKVGAA